jgi:BirA family biotin operon repressor/biotin-[acetyl-CoA-carboxylase] ligase
MRELDRDYARIRRGEFEDVAAEWREGCSTLGREVAIRTGERVVRGRAEALDADGALLVRTEHGRLERIIGGDVTLEKGE